MAETDSERARGQGRSPSFPFIPLQKAIERAKEFERHSKGHPVRVASAIEPWGYKPGSSGGLQTISALKAFGLVVDQGSNQDRRIQLTDLGRRLLKNPPASVLKELTREAALKPKAIRELWGTWGSKRPPRSDCIHTLTVDMGFTDAAASTFLNVYDATIAFAGLARDDTMSPAESDPGSDLPDELEPQPVQTADRLVASSPPRIEDEGVRLMENEREYERAQLSEEASFRLIVRGAIGSAEIGYIIKRLELTKMMLEDRERAAAKAQQTDDSQLGLSLAAAA